MLPSPSGIRPPVASTSPLLDSNDDELVARFLDRAPLPLVIADDERRLKSVNGPFIELFGYPADRALAMRIDDLLTPEARPGLGLRWSDLMAAGAATARVGVVAADGSRLDVRYTALAHVLPGRHLAAFLVQPGTLGRSTRARRAGSLTL